MTTITSRPVSMLSLNYNTHPVIDARRRLQPSADVCPSMQGNLFPRTRLSLVGNPPFQIV